LRHRHRSEPSAFSRSLGLSQSCGSSGRVKLTKGSRMRQLSASILRTVRIIVVSACLASTQSECAKPRQELTPDDVFQTTSIWEVHLTFTPGQWQAMEPKHGPPSRV